MHCILEILSLQKPIQSPFICKYSVQKPIWFITFSQRKPDDYQHSPPLCSEWCDDKEHKKLRSFTIFTGDASTREEEELRETAEDKIKHNWNCGIVALTEIPNPTLTVILIVIMCIIEFTFHCNLQFAIGFPRFWVRIRSVTRSDGWTDGWTDGGSFIHSFI